MDEFWFLSISEDVDRYRQKATGMRWNKSFLQVSVYKQWCSQSVERTLFIPKLQNLRTGRDLIAFPFNQIRDNQSNARHTSQKNTQNFGFWFWCLRHKIIFVVIDTLSISVSFLQLHSKPQWEGGRYMCVIAQGTDLLGWIRAVDLSLCLNCGFSGKAYRERERQEHPFSRIPRPGSGSASQISVFLSVVFAFCNQSFISHHRADYLCEGILCRNYW